MVVKRLNFCTSELLILTKFKLLSVVDVIKHFLVEI